MRSTAGTRKRQVAGLAVLLVSACGGKLAARVPDDPVTLRLSFVPGQVARYRTALSGVQIFDDDATPVGVTAETVTDVTHRVVSVDGDGAATLEVDPDPISARTGGQATPIGSNPEPWTVVASPQGAILDSTRPIVLDPGDEPSRDVPMVHTNPSGAINPFPLLATDPVGPGTGWSGSGRAPSPFGGGTVPFKVSGVLARYEPIAGASIAVVESRVVVTLDITVPADEYLEATGQAGFDLPSDAALDYDGELRYAQRTWLQPDRGQVLRTRIVGSFVTDVAWTDVPAGREGFEPVHAEGQLEATTERKA